MHSMKILYNTGHCGSLNIMETVKYCKSGQDSIYYFPYGLDFRSDEENVILMQIKIKSRHAYSHIVKSTNSKGIDLQYSKTIN